MGYSPWSCKRFQHDWATNTSFIKSFFIFSAATEISEYLEKVETSVHKLDEGVEDSAEASINFSRNQIFSPNFLDENHLMLMSSLFCLNYSNLIGENCIFFSSETLQSSDLNTTAELTLFL